jgi:hypothetical protein
MQRKQGSSRYITVCNVNYFLFQGEKLSCQREEFPSA